MAGHKYVKRTGTPGDYKYWYKLPDGRIVQQEDAEAHHGKQMDSKKDHLRRLIAARAHGHHSKTDDDISRETGIDREKVRWEISNMRQKGRRKKGDATLEGSEALKHGHEYEEHHLHEGHHEISHPDYAGHVARHKEEGSTASPRRSRTAPVPAGERHEVAPETPAQREETPRPTARRQRRAPEAEAAPTEVRVATAQDREALRAAGFTRDSRGDGTGFIKHVTGGTIAIKKTPEGKWDVQAASGETESSGPAKNTLDEALSSARNYSEIIERAHADRRADQDREEAASRVAERRAARVASRAAEAPTPAPSPAAPAAQAGPSAEALARARARVGRPSPAAAPAADPAVVERAQRAERAVAAQRATEAMRESSPSSPEASAVAEGDSAFAAADRPIQAMVEAQARGENPYLKRAKDIYHNIRGDVKPERKAVVDHVMTAIEQLGSGLNEASLVQKYKELSGKRIRGISGIAEDFEKATFMSMEEILGNAPINVEVERMKRGYAAKQFARMKPFLKESFTSANPSAPPPYPTFGDVKSWSEHGGAKPSWAGTTRLAMPQEVFDASVKGADGKPKYPPAWMPLHLMPVWNYVAKKSMAEGNDPYATRAVDMGQSGMPGLSSVGAQAEYQEGMMKAAIRKYVVMRGGHDNLVDIPASKLSEAGTSHHDIFKSEDEPDMDQILKTKIIDPVGLMKHVQHEMRRVTMKSFALVVDLEKSAVEFNRRPSEPFQKSFVIEADLKKSKIDRIRGLIREKSRS